MPEVITFRVVRRPDLNHGVKKSELKRTRIHKIFSFLTVILTFSATHAGVCPVILREPGGNPNHVICVTATF